MTQIFEPLAVERSFVETWEHQTRLILRRHWLAIGLHWAFFSILAFLINEILDYGQIHLPSGLLIFYALQFVFNIGLALFAWFLFCEMVYHIVKGQKPWKAWTQSLDQLLQFDTSWLGRLWLRYRYLFILFSLVTVFFTFMALGAAGGEEGDSSPLPHRSELTKHLLNYAVFFNHMIILLVSRLGNLSLSDQMALRLKIPAARRLDLGYQLALQALTKNKFLAQAYGERWIRILIIAVVPLMLAPLDVIYGLGQILSGVLLVYYVSFFSIARTLAYRTIFENQSAVEPQPAKVAALQTIPLI